MIFSPAVVTPFWRWKCSSKSSGSSATAYRKRFCTGQKRSANLPQKSPCRQAPRRRRSSSSVPVAIGLPCSSSMGTSSAATRVCGGWCELFGPDYPIISIDPHGLRGERIPPSIEEMAADRLPLILERQSSGPFLLGGKCNGAMVAFETARLLMAAGHKVDMVAMVDPPTVSARPVPRAIIGLMKPLVSPYLLRWAFEKMAELERYSKASTSAPITTAELGDSAGVVARLFIRNGAISSGTARGPRDFLRGRTRRPGVAASQFSTRRRRGAMGTSWLPDCRR